VDDRGPKRERDGDGLERGKWENSPIHAGNSFSSTFLYLVYVK